MNNSQRQQFDSFSSWMSVLASIVATGIALLVWWPAGLLIGAVLLGGRAAYRREQRQAALDAEAAARPNLHHILEANAYGLGQRSMPAHMRRNHNTWPTIDQRYTGPIQGARIYGGYLDEMGGYRAPAPRPTPLDDGGF